MRGNSKKVNPQMALIAIDRAKDRRSVYSQCVILAYRSTGRFDCGFNNFDLQAWIDSNVPEMFDIKGHKSELGL